MIFGAHTTALMFAIETFLAAMRRVRVPRSTSWGVLPLTVFARGRAIPATAGHDAVALRSATGCRGVVGARYLDLVLAVRELFDYHQLASHLREIIQRIAA